MLDSDEEAEAPSILVPGKAGADEGSMGSGAMDQMETQGFEVSTQVVLNVLSGLDQPVPSPARTFAEEKTLELGDVKSPEADASRATHEETPSPRGTKPVEITPVKSYPTRDSQLTVKATKESDAKDAGRGRGRGGRGKGGGRGKKVEAEEAEHEDPVATTEAVEAEVGPKRGRGRGGRGKKLHPQGKHQGEHQGEHQDEHQGEHQGEPDEVEDVAPPKKRRCKNVVDAPPAPSTRVRGKRGSEGTQKPKKAVKKVTKSGDVQWPKTFARRYRPNSDNWTQRLWEGCVLAFRTTLLPHIIPGQATALQAGLS